jgi:sugar/nucleoside kinase (ribokinase family)
MLIQLSGVIVDLVYKVEAVPRAGEEAVVHGAFVAAGGGFNAMAAARRAGMEVAYAGGLGTGPLAEVAAAALAAEGIACLRPRSPDQDQGCCTVLVDATGERAFIASQGADGAAEDADFARLRPGPGDWLLLSGYALSYPRMREAATRWLEGPAPGAPLLFDPSPMAARLEPARVAAALARAAWVSANGSEAAALTGLGDPASAAAALAEGRSGGAVVRVGAAGCWLAEPGRRAVHLAGHPVRPLDTNGAGDAHVGAFLAALARGESPERAARVANVTAALSTLREGPATAPALDAVRAAMGETTEAAQGPPGEDEA